jgi:hypothetical protein
MLFPGPVAIAKAVSLTRTSINYSFTNTITDLLTLFLIFPGPVAIAKAVSLTRTSINYSFTNTIPDLLTLFRIFPGPVPIANAVLYSRISMSPIHLLTWSVLSNSSRLYHCSYN